MGAIHTKFYFNLLRFIATRIRLEANFEQLKLKFQSTSKNRVNDLKQIYHYGHMKSNIGRMLAFVRFVEELRLTEGEWDELYSYL